MRRCSMMEAGRNWHLSSSCAVTRNITDRFLSMHQGMAPFGQALAKRLFGHMLMRVVGKSLSNLPFSVGNYGNVAELGMRKSVLRCRRFVASGCGLLCIKAVDPAIVR